MNDAYLRDALAMIDSLSDEEIAEIRAKLARRSIPQGDEPAKAAQGGVSTEQLLRIVAEHTGKRISLSLEDLDLYLAVAREAIIADRVARKRRVQLDPAMKAALDEAARTGATAALLPDGGAVFINRGHDYGDSAHLECTACGGSGHIEDQRAIAAAQGDELPPLPEPDTHCYDEDTQSDVWSYSKGLVREYGAACRAGRAKGEDARDAERYRYLVSQYPCNIADALDCGIREIGEETDRCIEEDKRRAAATAPEGKGE